MVDSGEQGSVATVAKPKEQETAPKIFNLCPSVGSLVVEGGVVGRVGLMVVGKFISTEKVSQT